MKKLLIPFLCFVAMTMFIGCNKKKNLTADGKIDAQAVAENVMKKAFEGEKYSKEAAEYYFEEGFGIKFKDLVPDYKLNEESKYTYYGEKKNSGNIDAIANFKIADDTPYTKEDHENQVRRIYALTKAASDNGINMYGFEEKDTKEEAMSEKDLEKMIQDGKGSKFMGMEIYIGSYGWTFLRDGKLQHCEINLLENKKEQDANGNNRKMGYAVKMYKALDKSFNETMQDAEKAFEDPEVQKQLKKAAEKM